MPTVEIFLDENVAWPDLKTMDATKHKDNVIHYTETLEILVLDNGMKSGRPSVMLRINLPDGKIVLAETSARGLCWAAAVIKSKYPDILEGNQPA